MNTTTTPKTYYMITTVKQAEQWYNQLTAPDLEYLSKIDKLLATFQPGTSINLAAIVEPANMEKFITCISFMLTICLNLYREISFNHDFTTLTRSDPWPTFLKPNN
jgi:hypothetical protein